MKNLMVTGGCGFIGSNFIHYLLAESEFSGRIINVDKLTYAGNLENLAGSNGAYPDHYVFQQADICDSEEMERIAEQYQIDAICHFAAESHVDRSIMAPDAFIRTNIIGTYTLLELVRKSRDRIELFHHISTDEVFGSLGEDGYFTERTPYDPSSPYSASKAASDHLVRAYCRTYDLPVTISNCSNNYGPYHFPEKLIPLMILNALEQKPLPVYGDGKNVRDWLFVRDHCEAVWTIMNAGRHGETYNIGGQCEMHNIDVVTMICDIIDETDPMTGNRRHRDLIVFVQDRPGHDRRYAIDFSKLNKELGWAPKASFEDGLRQTIQWYRDNEGWVDRVRSGEYLSWIDKQYDL